MSIRTTVTLDDDVYAMVKRESSRTGVPFRSALNALVRVGSYSRGATSRNRKFEVKPFDAGLREGLNYDDIESLIEYGEGELHR